MADPLQQSLSRLARSLLPRRRKVRGPVPIAPAIDILPSGLSPVVEDAIVGRRPRNRRTRVSGVLGLRAPVGTPGTASFAGRPRIRL